MDFIRINQYDVIKLENSGKYGWNLILGYENQAGEFRVKYCKRKFGKEEKVVPVSIPLGDKPAEILQALLGQLKEEPPPF